MCLLFSVAGFAGSEGRWICRFGKYGLFCACAVRYPDFRLSLERNASREILSKWVLGSGGACYCLPHLDFSLGAKEMAWDQLPELQC